MFRSYSVSFVLFVVSISHLGTSSARSSNPVSASVECGGLLQEPSVIQSPNYPHQYPPDVTCIWDVIIPSSANGTIHLQVESFDLGTPCSEGGDYIQIQAGPLIEQICGISETVHSMATNSRIVSISLVSKSDGTQGTGFSMDVSFIEDAHHEEPSLIEHVLRPWDRIQIP